MSRCTCIYGIITVTNFSCALFESNQRILCERSYKKYHSVLVSSIIYDLTGSCNVTIHRKTFGSRHILRLSLCHSTTMHILSHEFMNIFDVWDSEGRLCRYKVDLLNAKQIRVSVFYVRVSVSAAFFLYIWTFNTITLLLHFIL